MLLLSSDLGRLQLERNGVEFIKFYYGLANGIVLGDVYMVDFKESLVFD